MRRLLLSFCSVQEIEAPLDEVWSLLVGAGHLDLWWDAKVQRVQPAGAMAPGQVIEAGALRLSLFRLTVKEVDHTHHRLSLVASLPLGITDYATISCSSLGPGRCRVSYG